MPLYDYRCVDCNHTFEVTHEVGGTPGPCPVCGGPVRRVFSSIGLIFKGSGFHTTDYPKTPPAAEDGAPKTPASAPKTPASARKAPGSPPPAESTPPKS